MQPNPTAQVLERGIMGNVVPFAASGRLDWELGGARIAHLKGQRRWREDDGSACRLIFQCASSSQLALGSGAGKVELVAGHWGVQLRPVLEIDAAQDSEVFLIGFPSALLSRSLAHQLQPTRERTMRISGAAQMCLELARTSVAQVEPVSTAVAGTVGDSLVELAKLAIIEQAAPKGGETVRETVRTRIQGFILRNLADPDLTIDRIAERMHCTKRYLHKVFSEEGETLSQFIWSRRLELCRAQLARSDFSDKSITEIAFACGFSNAAHFSRSFRARFGEAPRTYRRSALDS